jgi:hypothetical protein
MIRSQEKLLSIAQAMKSYHLSRLTTEAVTNPCGANGGLTSNDDIMILGSGRPSEVHPGRGVPEQPLVDAAERLFEKFIWSIEPGCNTTSAGTIAAFSLLSMSAICIARTVFGIHHGAPQTRVDGTSVGGVPPAPCPNWSWSAALPPYGGYGGWC